VAVPAWPGWLAVGEAEAVKPAVLAAARRSIIRTLLVWDFMACVSRL
jgi:hypothetical protein